MWEQIWNGIISGIVASIFFTIIMMLIKPRIKVSSQMAVKRGNTSLYRVKVVNQTLSMLTNLKYTLHYCGDYEDGTTDVSEIKPMKEKLDTISKFSFFDKQASYAVRLSYEVDEKKFPMQENTRFVFTILADHAFSNTTRCKKIDYRAKDVVEGIFETKNSTKVIMIEHG